MARAPKNRIETQRLIRYIIWKAMNKKATDDDDDDGGDGDDEEGEEKEQQNTKTSAYTSASHSHTQSYYYCIHGVHARVCVCVLLTIYNAAYFAIGTTPSTHTPQHTCDTRWWNDRGWEEGRRYVGTWLWCDGAQHTYNWRHRVWKRSIIL